MSGTINEGDTIAIKPNVTDELRRMGFMDPTCLDDLVGTQQTAMKIWNHITADGCETFVTVDLCREVPMAACIRL